MAGPTEISSMALFCDFENIALGVRDARWANSASFDIRRVLEKLLLKGSIVVKKAYCDWDRYREFKRAMHEASFELIEIPHVRQSGKNSADIRMVVDALDLCYTKSHVDAFVIISGDSDFSPLVSKLRENNKHVIGIGVRDSTSDLLAANCDEFIFYDDLVRDLVRESAAKKTRARKTAAKTVAEKTEPADPAVKGEKAERTRRTGRAAKDEPAAQVEAKSSGDESAAGAADGAEAGDANERAKTPAAKRARGGRAAKSARGGKSAKIEQDGAVADAAARATEPEATASNGDAIAAREVADDHDADDDRRQEALDLLMETIEALALERGDDDKLWGSMVKQTMKRRRPGFNESSYGYKSFRDLVDHAASRNLLVVESDERPGQYALRLPPA